MSEEAKSPIEKELISVKAAVLGSPDFSKEHRKLVDNPQFSVSVIYTMAELARMNLSAEQLRGANAFVDTFTLLAEKERSVKTNFPVQKLTQ